MSSANAAAIKSSAADYRNQPDATELDHIPGSYGLPYFGSSLQFFFNLRGMINDRHRKWGEVSRIRMLSQRGLLVLGADNYQAVYLDRDRNFSTEMGYEASLGMFYKGGLLLRDFDDHKFQRRIMQSAFKTPAMKQYVATMNPILAQNVREAVGQQPLEFNPFIKEALLEVGARLFIGVDSRGAESKDLNSAFTDINEGLIGQIKKEWPGTRYGKGKKGERYLAQYFSRLIPQRRGHEGDDMLTYMCNEKDESGNYFDDRDLIAHAAFLLFAAHDTTTSVLNHLVMYSAMDSKLQQRIRDEVKSFNKAAPDYDDLDNMGFLDNCFHEVLRMHPSVPLMTRRTIRECEIGGYRVPANTMLWLPPIFNHTDPRYWSNPETFDPDRFSAERAEHKRHSFCYHPFGGGAHKCIGLHFANMLVKVFMFHFVQAYDYSTPAGFKPKLEWIPLPKPAALPLTLVKRC
jgi:cytochrome P450